jgi:ABC-type transport system substrate-binding protein
VRQVDSLNHIVNELLAFGRPRPPKIGKVRIDELIEEMAFLARGKSSAHIELKLDPDLPAIDGDREALKQAILNLMINAIQAIEVIDPLTVRLVLKAPASPLLAQLTDRAGIMISPKATEAAGAAFGQKPVCAGPYAFVERVAQDHITLKRHGGYWNPSEYHFDQVVYSSIPNSAVRVANLRAGSLDLVEYILPTDVEAIRKIRRCGSR